MVQEERQPVSLLRDFGFYLISEFTHFAVPRSRLTMGSRQFMEALDINGCPPNELVAVVIDYIIQTNTIYL